MSDRSHIEWTDATWNPITGCTKVSAGCDNCYAETLAERFRGTPGHYYEHGFDVKLRPEKLDQPLRWRRPRRIFVNSMSDLFHDAVPDDYIAQVFTVMALAPRHTFQVLTKRHGRMRSLLSSDDFRATVTEIVNGWTVLGDYDNSHLANALGDWWPLPNVWLGVSAENQQWADIRIPALLDTPAAVRFVSAEPLLGPLELSRYLLPTDSEVIAGLGSPRAPKLDWLIAGGESGRGARPMHPDWVRSLQRQCDFAAVAFLFKQAGSVLAREWGCSGKGTNPAEWPESFPREYPEVAHA